jgi:hypothetical protein
MKAEQIEQAAKEWADNFDSNIPEFGRIKQDIALLSYREGCKTVNKLQQYTAEDMKTILEEINLSHWDQKIKRGEWVHGRTNEIKTTDKLIKKWEEDRMDICNLCGKHFISHKDNEIICSCNENYCH